MATSQRKGDGKAGGGLKARIRDFEEIKPDNGYKYHRPGSQNTKKGGRGK